MRTKKSFRVNEICGAHVIVAEGEENIDFSDIISLNDSALLLWNSVEGKDFTIDDLADITGQDRITPQEILNNIFKHFCIGK